MGDPFQKSGKVQVWKVQVQGQKSSSSKKVQVQTDNKQTNEVSILH